MEGLGWENRMKCVLCLSDMPLGLAMLYYGCNKQAGFGQGERRDILKFAELKISSGFFVAANLLSCP